MRPCRDADLGLPFQAWIDSATPLDAQVRLIPRSIHPGYDLLAFTSSLVSFGAMSAFLVFFSWKMVTVEASYSMPIIVMLIAVGLLAVPWVLGRRWMRSQAAAGEQRRGQLRQGILVGVDGLLIRMEPNCCYAIMWDRYLGAKSFSRSAGSAMFQVETLDGPVNFPSNWLRTTLPGFEKEVDKVRPAANRPVMIPQDKRERRMDWGPRRRLLRLVIVFVTGCAIVLLSLIGVGVTVEGSPARDWSALGVFVGLLWTLGTVPYALWTFYRLSAYDCAECGERLPRADELRPDVVFYCAKCGIHWDTKLSEKRMPKGD